MDSFRRIIGAVSAVVSIASGLYLLLMVGKVYELTSLFLILGVSIFCLGWGISVIHRLIMQAKRVSLAPSHPEKKGMFANGTVRPSKQFIRWICGYGFLTVGVAFLWSPRFLDGILGMERNWQTVVGGMIFGFVGVYLLLPDVYRLSFNDRVRNYILRNKNKEPQEDMPEWSQDQGVAAGETVKMSSWTWPKKALSTTAIIVLALVGGCSFLIIKNAQPVNPVRAMTSETGFIQSGDRTDHIRAIEDKVIGSGRLVEGVDHTRLHIIGRYVEGEVFDDGILTYQIKWPPMQIPFRTALEGMKVGGVRRVVINVQLLGVDWQNPSRFVSFANEEKDDDSFRFRMDKGDLEFEVEVLDTCRPYEYEIVRNGIIGFAPYLGCW